MFIIGNYKHLSKFKIDPWELLLGKKMSGSWNKKFDYDTNFKKFYSHLKNFNLDKYFGNKIYRLEEINKAIKDLKNGKIIMMYLNGISNIIRVLVQVLLKNLKNISKKRRLLILSLLLNVVI